MPPLALLEQYYRTYGHVVVRRGRRLLGSDAEGQELLHDVFASLLARGEPTDAIAAPAAWLYAIATRRALTRIRDTRTRTRLLAEQLAPALDAGAATVPGRAAELADLVGALPDDELAAIVNFYLDELTHDEIAAQLGCSRRHVGNLLTRGRAAARRRRHGARPMTTPRSPACLSELALLQLDADELPAARRTPADAHVATCARCAAALAEIRADRVAVAGTTPLWLRAPAPRRRARWLVVPAVMAAAAGLFVVLRPAPAPTPPVDDGVRTKGGALVLEVFVNHAGAVRRAGVDEPVVAGDRLRFALRHATPAPQPMHAVVLSRDGAGQVTLFAEGAIALGPVAAPLPGAIALDATPGVERLLALACPTPPDVAALRQALAARGEVPTPAGCLRAEAALRKVAP